MFLVSTRAVLYEYSSRYSTTVIVTLSKSSRAVQYSYEYCSNHHCDQPPNYGTAVIYLPYRLGALGTGVATTLTRTVRLYGTFERYGTSTRTVQVLMGTRTVLHRWGHRSPSPYYCYIVHCAATRAIGLYMET